MPRGVDLHDRLRHDQHDRRAEADARRRRRADLRRARSSMRVWLHPDRMAQLGVTPADVASAIAAQNEQYAAGKIGAEPAPKGQQLTYTVTVRGRLARGDEFGDIVLRSNGPNGVLRLKDVARRRPRRADLRRAGHVDGKPAIGWRCSCRPAPTRSTWPTRSRHGWSNCAPRSRRTSTTSCRSTPRWSSRASIHEVQKTIVEAAILVLLVVFVFLQSWRATVIPMLAVPVSMIGTFAGLFIFGFSINTLTLFAMVLAIGIVVDDAIVVLENVERLMREEKMGARQAAIEAMREVSGALIAIVLVLCAVFVPVAFLGGIAGQLYKQFAVTVAVAVVISGFTALTLTPALCALLLRPGGHESPLFHPFNVAFAKVTGTFLSAVNWALRRRLLAAGCFLAVVLAVAALFWAVPRQLHPARGPGLPHQLDPAARRRIVAAHAQDRRAVPGDARPGSGHRPRLRRGGARLHRRRQQAQRGHLVHPAQGLVRAHAHGGPDRGRSQPRSPRVPRRHRLRLQPARDPRPGLCRGLRILRSGAHGRRPAAPGRRGPGLRDRAARRTRCSRASTPSSAPPRRSCASR